LPTVAGSAQGAASFDLADRTIAELGIVGADFPIAAFGSVWVVAADRPKPAVVRVSPESNEIEAQILVPGRRCQGMTAGFGSVWACNDKGIARIDPRTNKIVSLLDLPTVSSNRLATTADSIWAFTSANGVEPADGLLKIDPTSETAETIQLGHDAGTMTAAFGYLWVTSVRDGLLLRVDPGTGEVKTVMTDLPQPYFISAGLDSLWISLHGDPDVASSPDEATVLRVDPTSLAVRAEIAAGPLQVYGEVAADETGVWVRTPATFLTHYDTTTHDVLERITAPKGGGSILLAYGSVWVTSYDFGHIWRIAPNGSG
jgi:streptogramin lyase